ncbi:MAG: amino acid ABC transporter substrate-binding protein [Magnetovibrionaceae bacterium]
MFASKTFIAGLAVATAVALPAMADTIKIGAPLALTGGLADEGKKQEIVYQMWLDKVNADGGLMVGGKKMPVEIIKYDYQTDGKRAGQMTEKLVTDDKVDFIMAPFGSGHTKIAAAVAERYETPIVACVSSSLSVYNQGHKNLFGTLAPNTGLIDTMITYLKDQNADMKKVAILGRDDVFPRSMAKALGGAAPKFGLEVVYDELYAVGTLDHSASLSKIKSAAPDWIYVTGYTQDLILARKQMADLGVHAPVVTMVTGPAYKEFVEGLGELAEGVTSNTWWHHATAYDGIGAWPTTADFYKEFVEANGSDPDYVHASCAAGLVTLGAAIEAAGSTDKAAVRDALAATDINTFYGPIKFSDNGMNEVRDLPIIQVQSGAIKVLHPADIKNTDFMAVPK